MVATFHAKGRATVHAMGRCAHVARRATPCSATLRAELNLPAHLRKHIRKGATSVNRKVKVPAHGDRSALTQPRQKVVVISSGASWTMNNAKAGSEHRARAFATHTTARHRRTPTPSPAAPVGDGRAGSSRRSPLTPRERQCQAILQSFRPSLPGAASSLMSHTHASAHVCDVWCCWGGRSVTVRPLLTSTGNNR